MRIGVGRWNRRAVRGNRVDCRAKVFDLQVAVGAEGGAEHHLLVFAALQRRRYRHLLTRALGALLDGSQQRRMRTDFDEALVSGFEQPEHGGGEQNRLSQIACPVRGRQRLTVYSIAAHGRVHGDARRLGLNVFQKLA